MGDCVEGVAAVKLTAEMIEAFAGVYPSPRYDSPQPTPDFHRECWMDYCSDHPACARAAPRNHAKSTGLTHDFLTANAVFRVEEYMILVGATEEMAIEHLGDIANEFKENEELIRDFKIKGFITDQRTDIIVECLDGYQFRIIARGAEQKIRGRKWRSKRPGLIVGDDLEDDEQVESQDRRRKFRKWFFRACKQALRDGGRIRVHGTILHEDSLLARLMKNRSWNSRCYKAHESFDDFSNILWREKFSEKRLRTIRQEFINEQDSAGYSQEYLNDPMDNEDAYLFKDEFVAMSEKDFETAKVFACGVDFAISKSDSANRSSFTIGGRDLSDRIHIVGQVVKKMDSLEIVDSFFKIQEEWGIDQFFVEDGVIWKSVKPWLDRECDRRREQGKTYLLAIVPMMPIKDKAVRGRSLQKRMRSRTMRFAKESSWYAGYEAELLKFTGVTEAVLDDQFDSTAWLCKGFDTYDAPEEDDYTSDEEREFAIEAKNIRENAGRSSVTGY